MTAFLPLPFSLSHPQFKPCTSSPRRPPHCTAPTPQSRGQVTLISAGPGDISHLTTAAREALVAADTVLHDLHVSPDLLALAHPSARLVPVGKARGLRTGSQAGLDARMVALASVGRRVARLHAGDATTFARAASGLEACTAAGIPCDVVPGVTTASAVAAQLGFSLTQRNVADGVLHVTGHDGLEWLDPSLLMRVTVVVYMGLQALARILERWTTVGRGQIAAVAVMRACLPGQRVVWGTVATLADRVEEAELEGPTLVVVGEVVRSARDWPFSLEYVKRDGTVA